MDARGQILAEKSVEPGKQGEDKAGETTVRAENLEGKRSHLDRPSIS